MKIKLIAPKMSLRPMDSEFKRRMTPSISLLVLASLTPRGHEIEIVDENISPVSSYEKTDLVGITCTVDTFERAKEISRKFRSCGSPVVLGGIFPSSCPELAEQYADSVCVGEAEPLWPGILDDAGAGRLKKRYGPSGEFSSGLIPRPKWELVPRGRYLYTNIVTTSRGCPHRCEFCYNSCDYTIKNYRRRPVEKVIDEIARLETRQVLFVDDNFLGDAAWLRNFLSRIKPLCLTWHAAVSTDIGKNLPLLDMMRETGCRSLYIGFESINDDSLAGVNKKQNRAGDFERTIREVHDREIMVNASMVFGFDHDMPDVFDRTLGWLVENRIETMTGHILTPYPGTLLYKRLMKEGRIIDENMSHYTTAKVVFRPKHMTDEELLNGYLGMYDRFYSFRSIIRRRPLSRSQWYPYFLFNLGYRKFGKVTSRIGRLGIMSFTGKMARRLSYGIG